MYIAVQTVKENEKFQLYFKYLNLVYVFHNEFTNLYYILLYYAALAVIIELRQV